MLTRDSSRAIIIAFFLMLAPAVNAVLAPIASAQEGTGFAKSQSKTFQLFPNPKFLNCFAASTSKPPTATVVVTPGNLNDTLTLSVKGLKPNLSFDMFTVQNSSLNSDGTVDTSFTNFGLAWYQSDVQANGSGTAHVTIHTILVDQIFGFDAGTALAPTHTFHVGFWFNDPNDATACGFDASNPTPFNGEQDAGPLAMISVPDATTGLGPLCLHPNTEDDTCND